VVTINLPRIFLLLFHPYECFHLTGGYDERVEENKEYHLELEGLALHLGVKDHVTFMRSFTDDEKIVLLRQATCLLYTPSNEHFGIVPVEAMFMKCPVIACKSGGPLETVKDQVCVLHFQKKIIKLSREIINF